MRAAEHYDAVLRYGLTSQQTRTINAAIDNLFSRMCKATAGGDPEAKQTLETIEANRKAGRYYAAGARLLTKSLWRVLS
jgi:hypothetical protein